MTRKIKPGWTITEQLNDDAGDQFLEYNPNDCPKEEARGELYAGNLGCFGYMSLPLLESYWGKKWTCAMYYVLSAFNPTAIRITKDGIVTADGSPGRITVKIDDHDTVQYITQEVNVRLPKGIAHGSAMQTVLDGDIPKNNNGTRSLYL